jgi:hypothetical protein
LRVNSMSSVSTFLSILGAFGMGTPIVRRLYKVYYEHRLVLPFYTGAL